jgi:AcrR family transcriptional regulator
MCAEQTVPGHPGPGRPRNPDLDFAILDAALRLYGERGWSGLSIRSICERARVGRSAIYVRWSSLGELLTAAFASHLSTAPPTGEGIRADLKAEARRRAEIHLGDYRTAVYRLLVEGELGFEPIASIYRDYPRTEIRRARALIQEAIASGELPLGASARRILDRITGTVVMHIQSTPEAGLAEVRAGIDAYVDELVDDVLAAEFARAGNTATRH